MSDLLLPSGGGNPENVPTVIKVGKKNIDITDILKDPNLSPGQKRRKVLIRSGKRKEKKKYETPEERKAAAKARQEKKRQENRDFLSGLGLGVQERIKLSPEEKKERGKARRKNRREFLKTAALQNPDLAKQFNIDPSRFKTPPGFKI